MFNQLKKIIASNEMLLKNIIGAFVVKGGSLIISVVLLPLYLRFFGDQTVLGIWYTILSILNWVVLFDLGLGQGLRNQLPVFIEKNNQISNVTCYYDKEKKILSNPDRYFPCFLNFVFSIILGKRFHYGTNTNVTNPEWISGEFIITRASAFKKINGFDEDYFLYVEDIDFCYRAKKANIPIFHDKNHFIIHETQMASRKIFSKSFIMHLTSVYKFLKKHKITCLLKKVS